MSTNSPPTLPQLRNILQSVTAGLSTLDGLRSTTAHDRKEFQNLISQFLTSPTIVKFTAPPAHVLNFTSQLNEIIEIKSTLTALSKTVSSLHQKAATHPNQNVQPSRTPGTKGPTHSPLSYANATASKTPRASLVMNLKGFGIGVENRPTPMYLTKIFNEALKTSPYHQVHVAASWWTANANLVITGGHLTTAQQLRDCTEILARALSEDQSMLDDVPLPHPPTRPNVKWSKVLINGIPTGVQFDRENAYSPEECHEALASENPYYASLLVTQKPSWVRPPTSYTTGSSSSLVVAFEDPDGCKAKALLADKYLYAFGARATAKRWKQRPSKSKSKTPPPAPRTPSPPLPAVNWLTGGAMPPSASPSPFPPPFSHPAPPPSSPQKRKAQALSPFNTRASQQVAQPSSKKQATGTPFDRMAEDRPTGSQLRK
jgi:hypothetical protein